MRSRLAAAVPESLRMPTPIRTFPERAVRPGRAALRYAGRALRLRCPTCGVSPIFRDLRETRSLRDWLTPLEGCDRCRYRYDREPGYFLLAIFAFDYGATLTLGLALWAAYEWWLDLTVVETLAATMIPMTVASVALVRHCKSLFLAMDRWIDPGEPPRRATR